MRHLPAVLACAVIALTGCAPAGMAGVAPALPAAPATALAAQAPAAKVAVASIVHDGGIVFSRVPAGGFAVGGRLELATGVRVRLIMANGRSMIATPDAAGVFRFNVRPEGDRGFGVLTLRVEPETGGAHPLMWATGAGQSQAWLKLPAGRTYDMGLVTRDAWGAKAATNLLVALDADGDGTPDATDLDDDGDGIADRLEQGAFTYDPNESHDNDLDGLGDVLDTDDDNDGVPDAIDRDDDGDVVPDALDPDDDNDGVPDVIDLPAGAPRPGDRDGDGVPDAEDRDADGNGIPDDMQIKGPDTDVDGLGDQYDTDDDNDGYLEGAFSDGLWRADSDGDGVVDWQDVRAGDEPSGYEDPDGFGMHGAEDREAP